MELWPPYPKRALDRPYLAYRELAFTYSIQIWALADLTYPYVISSQRGHANSFCLGLLIRGSEIVLSDKGFDGIKCWSSFSRTPEMCTLSGKPHPSMKTLARLSSFCSLHIHANSNKIIWQMCLRTDGTSESYLISNTVRLRCFRSRWDSHKMGSQDFFLIYFRSLRILITPALTLRSFEV